MPSEFPLKNEAGVINAASLSSLAAARALVLRIQALTARIQAMVRVGAARFASVNGGALGAVAIGVAVIAPAGLVVADQDAPVADTSGWKCSQCPFMQGYAADVEVGALYARGANAYFGRYSGIDHSSGYADAAAAGKYRSEDGTYADYDLERLGLASREGVIEGGREGRFDVKVSYDGQPERLYDTAVTPFRGSSSLGLPANWVAAGSTAGMSALGQSLGSVPIESNRRTVALLGRYFVNPSVTLFGEFRRQEKNGTGMTSASFLTEAMQLPRPIDYVTNSFEAGGAWAGRMASFRLSYTGSWFEDNSDSLTYANPYLPIVADSTLGRSAEPPSNQLQQLSATGNVQLPWYATTLSFTASVGRLRQNAAFLPVSTLIGAGVPGSGSLDGNVHLSHYAVRLASRPLPKLTLRGNAAYDGRDDKTTPLAVDYVVTDTFPGGSVLTPRFSEDRVRLDGGADYALGPWLKVGVGGKFKDNHYGPGQVIRNLQETEGYFKATAMPLPSLSFTLKGGSGLRKTSSFDTAALLANENPLVRPYDYAPRDRVFYTLTGSWAATATLTWTVEGFLAKDDYRSSPLGLQSSHEARGSTTLAWTPSDTLSTYLDAGYQRLFTLQDGYGGVGVAPWAAADKERFWNLSAGGRWVPQQRWTLTLDYLLAPSYGDTDTTVQGSSQGFPQNWSKLDTTRLGVAYRWTPALQVRFRYTRETYNSSDWALNGVGPATLPNLLALGIQPYRDNVNLFGLSVRYEFGHDKSAVAE